MRDDQPDEGSLSSEERVNRAFSNATTSGGAQRATRTTPNGQWVFADLHEIDSVIKEWKAVRASIRNNRDQANQAIRLCNPPAADSMSQLQAQATRDSLQRAHDKLAAMTTRAELYVAKLTEARNSMAATEQDNTDRLQRGRA